MSLSPEEKTGRYSRGQVSSMLGFSNKALRYYEKAGICAPAYTDESNGYKYYSDEQLLTLSKIKLASKMGIPLSTLGEYIDEDGAVDNERIFAMAYRTCMDEMRVARRSMKNVVRCREALEDVAACGDRDDWYLRYLPMRWCAVLPVGARSAWSLSASEAAREFAELRGNIDLYGWSGTDLSGTVTSMSLDGARQVGYVFVELSTPPSPEPGRGLMIDSGCYKPAGYTNHCPDTTIDDCAICGRAGIMEAIERWEFEKMPAPQPEYTLSMDEMEEPYLTGPWTVFTHERIAARKGESYDPATKLDAELAEGRRLFPEAAAAFEEEHDVPATAGRAGERATGGSRPYNVARRPMLMPQVMLLPLGVTALCLPAGVYLCHQHVSDDGKDSFVEEGLGFARGLLRHPLSRDEEHELHLRDLFTDFSRPTPDRGPVPAPYTFANSRVAGDIDKRGWCESLADVGSERVELVTGTGLFAEHDLCAVDELILLPHQDDPALRELQLLVYTDALPER